jgi:hypothetical protein
MSGRTEARRLVNDVFKQHGFIPQEILDRLSPTDRTVVVEALSTKDAMIASSVTTYATRLYCTTMIPGQDWLTSLQFGK